VKEDGQAWDDMDDMVMISPNNRRGMTRESDGVKKHCIYLGLRMWLARRQPRRPGGQNRYEMHRSRSWSHYLMRGTAAMPLRGRN
jgi:hypothetical protein